MSHKTTSYNGNEPLAMSLRSIASLIEEITGRRPPTCPWRVFYDPLVQEVVEASGYASEGNLGAFWGDDAPALWLDALHTYRVAREATKAHWARVDRKKAEAERKKSKSKR